MNRETRDDGERRSIADRIPPQNLDAEKGVIGSALLDNSVLDEILPVLRPDAFWRDSHQVLYRAIRDLHDAGKPVDAILLEDELRRNGTLERAGGLEAILDCANSVPHSVNARYYAQVVREKATARALVQIANDMLRDLYSETSTADELLERAEGRIMAIGERDADDRVQPIQDAADAAIDRIQARSAGIVDGFSTGFVALDELLGGLVGGRLIILAARPSAGKTALALNVAEFVAGTGRRVLFVSREMGTSELVERLISARSEVHAYRIRDAANGNLTGDEWNRIGRAGTELGALPIWVDDSPNRSARDVASVARRIKSRDGLDLIVVDYLQLLDPDADGARASRQEQVSQMSRRLKSLSRELDVPVLALSQLNRAVENREDRRPRLADLRESGAIEQDADQVLLLHRPDYYDPNDRPGMADVIVGKNRHGSEGTVNLYFERSTTRFKPSDAVMQPDF